MAKNPKQSVHLKSLPTAIAIKCIHAYQWVLSPWIGNQCRFTPSCSNYAIEAYERHGFFKGCWLTLKRIVKCNPWHKGGLDLVPDNRK